MLRWVELYTCGSTQVVVTYTLRPGAAFVEKRLGVSANGNPSFTGATLFDGVQANL